MSSPAPGAAVENALVIVGRLVEIDALRHTPAGIAIVRARLAHQSMQLEAGIPRVVDLELALFAVGDDARLLAAASIGLPIRASGFLAVKAKSSRQLVLHATRIEFLGERDGIRR